MAARSADETVARKVVTIVFADLIGSTALHERLDAESARQLMDRYYRALREVVTAHGGAVVKLLGDGVMAAFGVPRVAEDDALRAVRAAVGMQRAFRALVGTTGDVGLRVGVNTGEVIVSPDHADVVGDPVNVAARLQQAADDGQVLIGDATRRLVAELVTLAPFGRLSLKGRSEHVVAHRVVSLERPAGARTAPFVGRDDEIRRLEAAFDDAVAARATRLAVVLGSPGLGKSRLLGEVARRLDGRATVLTIRSEATGGATLAALADTIRDARPLDEGATSDAVPPADDADRTRVAAGVAALLAGTPPPPEETFFVVRRHLAALAATVPVVLAIDDLQWAEPLLLDLTEHLVQWGAGSALFVLAAARPELRAVRPSLVAPHGAAAVVLTLGGLDAGAATRLAASVIGADALPAAVTGRVLATSEGNPLFVGELVRMLVHDGALKREGDRWTAGVEIAALEMPPTIHALLAARIERLQPGERIVLERAAVVGRHFSRAAVAQLLGADAAGLDAHLDSLRHGELIEADGGTFVGDPALRFHHVLVRDAAYRRVLKGTRAALHAQVAAWLEARVGDAPEHGETIGWHLEQAHANLCELGPVDERGRDFGRRAARHLAAAGRRALEREDLALAASLLERALARLKSDDPERAGLVLDRCEALLAAGEVGPAGAAIAELDRLAAGSDRLRAWHTCFAGQLAVLTEPQALRATADAVAAAAHAMAVAGDVAGEAKAHAVHATALARLGQIGACEAALDRALAAARRARDRRRANAVLGGAPTAALWGPSPVTRASGRCLDVVRVLRITQGAPAVEAVALRCQAVLEALRGRADAARRMIAASRRMVQELGITQRVLEADVFAGLIALLEGDASSAERMLRSAYEALRAHGLGIDAAQAAALLGRALLAQDRAADAEAATHQSEALAGDDLKAAIAWRGVRAEALARRGAHAAAIDLARAAVDIAAATDALLDHADARLALATALRAAGRPDEATVEEIRAVELWDAKGAAILADRVRHRGAAPAARGPDRATAADGRRRVRTNGATVHSARVEAAIAARDHETLARCLADDLVVVHHPTGVVHDAAATVAGWRALLRAEVARWRLEPLATLGASLGLFRQRVSAEGATGATFDVAAYDRDELAVIEVNADGLNRHTDVFPGDRMGQALGCLFERHAALAADGAERHRAVAIARALAAVLAPPDLERFAEALADDVEFADRRSMGLGHGRGREAFLRGLGALLDVSGEAGTRVDDVLAVEPDALLLRWVSFGTDRAGGGRYERPLLLLLAFDAAGLLVRFEQFDPERVDEALARFDALRNGAPAGAADPGRPFASRDARDRRGGVVPTRVHPLLSNAATRTADRFDVAWTARDGDGVAALVAPGYRRVERRRALQVDLDRRQYLEGLRLARDQEPARNHRELVATRGERLALFRRRLETGDGAVGPSEVEWLEVLEVDARGDCVAGATFDADDLAAAYAHLEARFDAGEAAAHPHMAMTRAFLRAFAARDWPALTELLAPDLTVHDHRLLGWEPLRGPEAYVEALRSLVELAPDVRLRVDHVRMSREAIFYVPVWVGTRDGGAFETPSVFVAVVDERGRIRRFDQYDLDQLDEAGARFAAADTVPSPEGIGIPSNTATRVIDGGYRALLAHDWDALEALCAPELVMDDRRRGSLVVGTRDTFLASCRDIGTAATLHVARTLLATAGDRLALERTCWSGTSAEGAPFEVDTLSISEVDAADRLVAVVVIDPEDRRAAAMELPARYARGEGAGRLSAQALEVGRAFNAHDVDALRAALPPDFDYHDHRRTGSGRLGREEYVASAEALFDQTPDGFTETLWRVAETAHGSVEVARLIGTVAGGGSFETVFVRLLQLRDGCLVGLELFELDDVDLARARLDAL